MRVTNAALETEVARARIERDLGAIVHRIAAMGGTVYIAGGTPDVDVYWDDDDPPAYRRVDHCTCGGPVGGQHEESCGYEQVES